MANKLNAFACYTEHGNTGHSDCDVEPDFPLGDLLIPHGHTFSLAETATSDAFIAAIQAGLTDDNPDTRFFFLGYYEDNKGTGEAPVTESFASGRKRTVRRGTVGWDNIVADGMLKYKQHFIFSGRHREFDAIRIDKSYVAWGRTTKDGSGNNVLGGRFLNNLFISNYAETDGSKGGQWTVSLECLDAQQVNRHFGLVQMDSDPFDAGTGFISIELINPTSSGPTNITIQAKTVYGADLHDLFPSELAVVGAWKLRNALTKATITISAVSSNANGWTISPTAAGTDPDNPGTGGKVLLSLAAPSVLDGLNVSGFESDEIEITLG